MRGKFRRPDTCGEAQDDWVEDPCRVQGCCEWNVLNTIS